MTHTRNRSLLRRPLVGLIAAGAAASALVACSSSPSTSSASTSSTSAASAGASGSGASGGGSLKTIHAGTTAAGISVYSANFAIGQTLGCYARYGYQLDLQGYGSSPGLIAAMQKGTVDIGVPGTDQFISMAQDIKTGGGGLSLKAITETVYPFRWGAAVNPDSSITSYSQLAGKNVGIDSLADSSSPILKAVLQEAGVDPNSVHTTVTGPGAASGQALKSGRVDALFSFDTEFGTVLQSGIKLKFLTAKGGAKPFLPISGVVGVMPTSKIASDKSMAQAFAQCTAEGTAFVEANPVAAAYIMLKQYPTLGSPGEPVADQLAPLALSLKIRAAVLENPGKGGNGAMSSDEFTQDLKYLLPKISPSSVTVAGLYTNEFVPALSSDKLAQLKQQATDYKMDGVSTSDVNVLPIPADAP
jgi:NitT/TauT family transport system substrate-binding protein